MITRAQVEQKEGALPSPRHTFAPGDRSILPLPAVILQGGKHKTAGKKPCQSIQVFF